MNPYDTLTQLRLRNLMQPQGAPTSPNQGVQAPQANDLQSQSDQIQAPDATALQRYQQSISQVPQPQSFQPGNMQKIAALAASLGTTRPAGMYGGNPVGMVANPAAQQQVQTNVLQAPYNRAIQAWQAQNAPLAQSAQLEAARNQHMMQYQQMEQLRKIQQQRADTYNQLEQDRADYQNKQADTKQAQEALNEWSTKNPNHKITITPQGVFSTDPKTNETVPITVDGQPLSSGKLSDQDKLMVQFHNKLAEIKAIGTRQEDVEGVKQQGRTDLEGQKQTGRTDLETQKSGARLQLKQTPAPPAVPKTTTTTTTDKTGQIVGKKTAITTSQPQVVKMLAPDGKTTGTVDPKDVERLKAAGYKVQ